MLEDKYKQQIEDTIGRALTSDEVHETDSLNHLSEPQLAIGRILVDKQLVLCIKYLQALVPSLDQRTASKFMDAVLHYGADAATWRSDR